MKQEISNFKRVLVIRTMCMFALAMLLTIGALAQDDLEGAGSGGTTGGETVPVNGGISLLAAAGLGYGLRKAREAKTKGLAIVE